MKNRSQKEAVQGNTKTENVNVGESKATEMVDVDVFDGSADDSVIVISSTEEHTPGKVHDEQLEQNTAQDVLYTALYSQMLHIENCVMKNEERTMDINAGKEPHGNPKLLVNICRIEPDGDCLFASIVHQLYYVKINSEEHKKLTADLRRQVVEYVCKNIDPFLHNLKDRLIEIGIEVINENLTEKCLKFVKEDLSRSGIWGGEETLKAVAEIYSANILLILNHDTCILGNRFNPSYGRALAVTYRCVANERNRLDHYVSVAELSSESLQSYVIKTIELKKQNILFQKAILNCDNISIDID